jgi:hypothetical protein
MGDWCNIVHDLLSAGTEQSRELHPPQNNIVKASYRGIMLVMSRQETECSNPPD